MSRDSITSYSHDTCIKNLRINQPSFLNLSKNENLYWIKDVLLKDPYGLILFAYLGNGIGSQIWCDMLAINEYDIRVINEYHIRAINDRPYGQYTGSFIASDIFWFISKAINDRPLRISFIVGSVCWIGVDIMNDAVVEWLFGERRGEYYSPVFNARFQCPFSMPVFNARFQYLWISCTHFGSYKPYLNDQWISYSGDQWI